jgi:hypothetical protein
VLILDTETTTDPTQRLTFGWYRYCRWEDEARLGCAQEGLFYADELPDRDAVGFAILRAFADAHAADVAPGANPALWMGSRRDFVNDVLWPAHQAETLVCGFNLPFDLSRLAIGWGEARRSYAGGFSFTLWEYCDAETGEWRENRYRPRLRIKPLDSKRARIGFASPVVRDRRDPTGPGRFLDLRTLAFALTDRGHSLASACKAFAVAEGKADPGDHGTITPEYVAYARQDVRATQALLERLRAEFDRHPIDLPPDRALSPASLAKSYLRAMGVCPVLERQPDFPRDVLGAAASAYFGGRAECRIRLVPVPVVYVDVLSMYPSTNALMGLWRFIVAKRIDVRDATEEVRAFLEGVTLDGTLRPGEWPHLAYFAQVVPDGDVLPVRARYDNASDAFNIGVNSLASDEALWYAGPDLAASAILTGKAPRIVRAVRLVPMGRQRGLRPVSLRGVVDADPRCGDFFRTVIEERKRCKARDDLPPMDQTRLDRFLKVLANSGSYGILAEQNRQTLPSDQPATVTVYGLDATPFEARTTAPETPGVYCFPPLAALITAAAKLMLALIERLVTDAGGTYAFCDTDSMAVVATETGGLVACPGGSETISDGVPAIRALSWAEVDAIVGRLDALNPYDRAAVPEAILKVEDENFDTETGERRQLWCLAISAKRYALYDLDADGTPVVRKASEHGLGHLLNPTDPDAEDRSWIEAIWDGIVRDALELPSASPAWLDRTAVSRTTTSSPRLMQPFEIGTSDARYADGVKPFNFALSAHVAPLGHPLGVDPARFHLIAPYTADARQWTKLRWTDVYAGNRFAITTKGRSGCDDLARVRSYGEVVADYRTHPEPKSLGYDGRPCARETVGLLMRRPVGALSVVGIGKEANRLDEVEAGLVHAWDDVQAVYRHPDLDPWRAIVLPVLRELPAAMLAQESGLTVRAVKAARNGRAVPRGAHRDALSRAAADLARESLRRHALPIPRDDIGACVAYLGTMNGASATRRFCPACGRSLGSPNLQARFCSPACRQRAARGRRQTAG